MDLGNHDTLFADAQAEVERTAELNRSAKAELEAKQLELHHAPRLNDELAEAQAEAELDGDDAPTGEPIDIGMLERQVAMLRKRSSIFHKGWQDATARLSEARQHRGQAYGLAFQAMAEEVLPRPAASLRSARPSLHDYESVTIGQLWEVYLLRNAGRVSRNPNDFGAFMGRMFAIPEPSEDWPALRDQAIVWAADQNEQEEAA